MAILLIVLSASLSTVSAQDDESHLPPTNLPSSGAVTVASLLCLFALYFVCRNVIAG